MGTKYQCDICGFLSPLPMHKLTLNSPTSGTNIITNDLCQDCKTALTEFILNRRKYKLEIKMVNPNEKPNL